MGADRKQHIEQSTAEVSKKLSAEFHVDYRDIYKLWREYNISKENNNMGKPIIIQLLSVKNLYKQKDIFSYLICFALETINMEMIKEITDGKKTVN